jgi:hypothetical protein
MPVVIIAFLVALLGPFAFQLYREIDLMGTKVFIVAIVIWVIIFTLLVMTVDFLTDFFKLFLPNAIRIKQPISFVYSLRYKDGMSDDLIKMFGTKEWNELVKNVLDDKDETVLFDTTPQ